MASQAPEVLEGIVGHTRQADVYALGMVGRNLTASAAIHTTSRRFRQSLYVLSPLGYHMTYVLLIGSNHWQSAVPR